MTRDNEVYLVYDGKCPICNNYVQKVQIENSIGKLHLIDARKESSIMNEITSRGLDIDDGMVLKIKDKLYYNSDAINMLALIGTKSNLFNKINYFLFSNNFIAKILYPICKFCRNILLKVLNVPKIRNLEK